MSDNEALATLVNYGGYDVEVAENEGDQLKRSTTGVEFMKLQPGRNVIRILPPPVGKRTPFRVTYTHYLTQPGMTNSVSFVCPRMEKREACAICQKADELGRSGSPIDKDMAYDLRPKLRVFVNVLDRRQPERGPLVLGIGKSIHERLIELRKDPDAGGDYTHPIKGFDIIIERKGTGKNDTEYSVSAARNATQLAPDPETMVTLIEGQHDLERFAQIKSNEEMMTALDGGDEIAAPPQRQLGAGGGAAARASQHAARVPSRSAASLMDGELPASYTGRNSR